MGQHIPSGGLYRPVIKEGTHLASSKETEGTFRGSLLDDETNQVAGQAEWVKVDENEFRNEKSYDYEESSGETESSFVSEVAAVLAIVLFNEFIAPHAKSWWQEKAEPTMKNKWGKLRRKKQSKQPREDSPMESTELATANEVERKIAAQKYEKVYKEYEHTITSEEARCEVLEIFMLSAISEAKKQRLANAKIIKDSDTSEEYLEGQELINIISSPEYIARMNQMLENNPMLLEEKSAALSELLGRSVVPNSQNAPMKPSQE